MEKTENKKESKKIVLIVLLLVVIILLTGYIIYNKKVNKNDYIRIYQSSIDLGDSKSKGVTLGDLEVSVIGVDFHDYEVQGNVSQEEQELYVDIKLKHNDEILLEPIYDYIIYDENNKILSHSSSFNIGNENMKYYLMDFLEEKYGSKDIDNLWKNSFSGGGSDYNINNEEIKHLERRMVSRIPKDYVLEGKLFVRLYNIRYKVESIEELVEYKDKVIELVVE